MAQDNSIDHLNPLDFLQITALRRKKELASQTALVILNQPVPSTDLLNRLWTNSCFRIAADGGANRLYDSFSGFETTLRGAYVPNLIHGDLDSLRKDAGDFYTKNKCAITRDPDQYSTDFSKCIARSLDASTNPSADSLTNIVVLGSLSGRVDQGLGTLSELLRQQTARPDIKFWLFSESSISFVLRGGRTSEISLLRADNEGPLVTDNVGILPIFGPARISTSGLEWDVQGWETMMGGSVSTSNHVKEEIVRVESDVDVLFTIERGITGT